MVVMVWSLQENRGILMAEIVRNSSELTDSDEFLTNLSVGIVLSEKKIRRNFVRTSDDFLTNTEKRHSDEFPTILRCGHTRPEFLGQFRRSGFLGIFRRILGVGIYRRTLVRRNIPTDIGSSEISDGYWFVGVFRRILVRRYIPRNRCPSPHEFSNPLNVFFRKQIGVRIQMRKLLTALRRLSDKIPTDVKQSVGIPSVFSNLKRLYNGHIYLSATVTWFVGNSSENSDGIPTTVLLIGMSSEVRWYIPTTHISSEFRRKWPTKFRRLQIFGFRRKLVGNPSQTSDNIDVRRNLRRNSACFLVVGVC
ncbi:hypothetical protein DY000_02008634 [Brassica cretica]|uniref:Uncharacterized protein n=1 Tax=Brassica cretica TaxID=69181 RepID=A0ABQ7CF62_BRACR|nr:hypothetical protein DY000_02008634 [Brassica cretica]